MVAIRNIKVLLLGYGNWGSVHLKTLNALTDNWKVYDINQSKLQKVYDFYGAQHVVESHRPQDLFDCEAVIIATSSDTHFPLAKEYLKAGKHVLVEKPVVKSKEELKELIQIANECPQVFMAGHTLMYSDPHLKVIEWANKQLDEPITVILRRMKKNPIKGDDEIYRLAPHDLSLLDRLGLLEGESCIDGNALYFSANGSKANVVVSWFQDPPIRDFYVMNKNHVYYHDDSKHICMFDNIPIKYDRTPPLLREHLAFLSTIAGENLNNSDIHHVERVYRSLTNLKQWEPYEVTVDNRDEATANQVEYDSESALDLSADRT